MLEVEPTGQSGRMATGSSRNGWAYRFAAVGAILCLSLVRVTLNKLTSSSEHVRRRTNRNVRVAHTGGRELGDLVRCVGSQSVY